MPDNTIVKSGTLGSDIAVATDDIGGVHHQRVKIQFGEDGQAADVHRGSPLPVDLLGGTSASRTQVADTTTETLFLAANSNRKSARIYNTSSADLYLGEGTTTVSSSNFTVKIPQNGLYITRFRGQIRGVWASDPNDGGARITEIT